MLIKNSECFRNLFQTLASTLPVPKPSFIQEHIHFSPLPIPKSFFIQEHIHFPTLPIPKPSFIQEHIHFPVSTKEVATFTDTPPNILAQPAMLMDALKGYQLNCVPTRGHAKAQAKAVGMDLCGAPVTAVCTVPCLKINSKLQSLLLPVIQSKCLVLALTPCKLSFQHLPCRLFSLTPGLYLAPASQTSGMLVLDNFCL